MGKRTASTDTTKKTTGTQKTKIQTSKETNKK
jgi:hypothetical protein